MGHCFYGSEVPGINGLIRKTIEQIAHLFFIGRFDWPETNLQAIFKFMGTDYLGGVKSVLIRGNKSGRRKAILLLWPA